MSFDNFESEGHCLTSGMVMAHLQAAGNDVETVMEDGVVTPFIDITHPMFGTIRLEVKWPPTERPVNGFIRKPD